ncbi:hypothetical protein EJ02DRAFT_431759 [Clathrospora elynae]|uniref:Uncharacterized protein n=1 Tax=Clathrospora elynae TaxID=706981 RepID=A0A6A5T837_9PLEO|nr:hypothetical protein EJ02DRAFT_431759 [Clathrospora elynae]
MSVNQAEALAQLEKANQERLKKEYSGKVGTKFVTEVRESMLFQYNWADLLSAAPTALSLLGACHVASSSQEASGIFLSSMPKGGWKYLLVNEKPTLKACLVYVGDCGANAFGIAANNMDSIAGTAGDLTEIVTEVIRATQRLPDPSYVRILDNKLNQLRRLSDSCLNYADDTEKAFDVWLLCVTEFHTASVQKHGNTEAAAEASNSLKLQAEIEATYKDKEINMAEKAAEAMLKSLSKAEDAFQKANNDVPSAWETCAMGAINSIAQAGPSIIAQTLPALINGMNPMSAVTSLAGAFGKAASNGAANAPGASPLVSSLIGAVSGQAAANGAGSISVLASAAKGLTPPTDPAYVAAPLIAPFVNNLYVYLTQGPDNSIDWSKFKDTKKDEDGKVQRAHSITWLLTNVKQQEKSAQLGTGEPSEALKGAFAKTIKTIESIKTEVLKSSDMASGPTAPEVLQVWQADMKDAKAAVLQLETTAKSFPGSSVNTPQLRHLKIDVPKTDYTAQTAALSTATEKLAINQRALDTAQQNYQTAAESALKVQQELTAIQTKLKGLEVEGQTLEKVKEILVDCIATLVQLKVQVNKLKSFFGALSTMVRVVVQNKVKKFDEDVSSVALDAKKKQILRLTDMDIEIIYSSTLQIKAYFELLQTIARMYCKMHVEHVSQGIELVWELSKVLKNESEVRAKRDALNSWADAASKAILKTIGEKQNEIKEGLEQRIENMAEQTQMLEQIGVAAPDPTFVAAMKTGAATITEHVEKNMPQSLAFDMSEDISS